MLKVATVCTDMCVVEHVTVELLGQWGSGRSNDTPRWVAVSSGQRRESCYGRRIVGAHPTTHSPRDLGQGYWAATATVRCIARQELHGITCSVSWSILSEEVSCCGTNRRQKALTEQDVTVISAINFYTKLNEHQFGNSKLSTRWPKPWQILRKWTEHAGDARLIPASSGFQVGHTGDRSESVFSILETSVFEFHF